MTIGIFDSGIGGLTVLKALRASMPGGDYVYLGDSARAPYGGHPAEIIRGYAIECASFLVKKYNVKALVVACNTVSSYALDLLRERFEMPVVGVIVPSAKAALAATKNSKIGVIGTMATITSKAYGKTILKLGGRDDIEIYPKACPLLVPLIEEGMLEGKITEGIVRHYLDDLAAKEIDTLVLGCTHYPLLSPVIKKLYPKLKQVDSRNVIIGDIREAGIDLSGGGQREILTTYESPIFARFARDLLGANVMIRGVKL